MNADEKRASTNIKAQCLATMSNSYMLPAILVPFWNTMLLHPDQPWAATIMVAVL